MMQIIDSHCHLDDDRYGQNLDQVLKRAEKAGIIGFVVPATTRQRWNKLTKLQEANNHVHIAYGLHPCFMGQHEGFDISELETVLDSNSCVAIGECGLDFYKNRDDEKHQKALFLDQLAVAKNHHLPVIVHSRKSLDDVLASLRKIQVKGGVVHSFSGSLQQAQQLIDLNFKLGIAATVCFDRAKKLQSVVESVPIQNLLFESDAPDQPGPHYKGQLNEPAFIIEQLHKVALLKQLSVEEVMTIAYQTTKQLFAL